MPEKSLALGASRKTEKGIEKRTKKRTGGRLGGVGQEEGVEKEWREGENKGL